MLQTQKLYYGTYIRWQLINRWAVARQKQSLLFDLFKEFDQNLCSNLLYKMGHLYFWDTQYKCCLQDTDDIDDYDQTGGGGGDQEPADESVSPRSRPIGIE